MLVLRFLGFGVAVFQDPGRSLRHHGWHAQWSSNGLGFGAASSMVSCQDHTSISEANPDLCICKKRLLSRTDVPHRLARFRVAQPPLACFPCGSLAFRYGDAPPADCKAVQLHPEGVTLQLPGSGSTPLQASASGVKHVCGM